MEIWEEEGTGAFNSWRDTYHVRARKSGGYVVSVSRSTIDSEPHSTETVFRSGPLKSPVRILDAVLAAYDECSDRPLGTPDVLRMLGRLIEEDVALGKQSLRACEDRLRDGARCHDLLG